ncbi:hypothetical protein ACET3Z_033122 [Daucus carota]
MNFITLSVIDVTIDRSIRLNHPIDELSHVVGSCNGLLCLADKANELYLWNPVTRQIKDMNGYKYTVVKNSDDDISVAFGFGFDPASSDYKAVRIVQKFDDNELVNRVEVYSLNEDCWKEINVELEIGLVDEPLCREVTGVNGSIYWFARKRPHDFGLVTGELIGWKLYHRYEDEGRICYGNAVVLYDSVNDVVKSIQPILQNGRRILYHYTESL